MTRTSRFALLASAIAAALAAALAVGAPASAAGITVQSVTISSTELGALQTITADVRGYLPVVQVAAPLAQFVWYVRIKGSAVEVPADCTSGGPGVWNCAGGLETDGNITITYRFTGAQKPGTYTVSASMGNNGVTYTDSGTVTIVGPVPSSGPTSPPTSTEPAPTSPHSSADAPAKGGGAPAAPGTTSPVSSAGPTTPTSSAGLTATPTAPAAATTQSDPTGLQVPVAATVATQRPGHSGSITTVAVIAGLVAAAAVAASLFIRRRLRRDRDLPDA